MSEQLWPQLLLDALAEADVGLLPYVPDGVLAPVIDLAGARPEFTLVPLTREEEGVGIACGAFLGGRRAALLMQTSGMGNSLNAVGSLAMAQRIPLLMVVTERGGLGETVSTQIPFGAALRRVLDAVAIPYHEVTAPSQVAAVTAGAAKQCFVSRVPVVVLLSARLEVA